MHKITTLTLALALMTTLVLTGIGCGAEEQGEEISEEQTSLLEEAGLDQAEGYEADIPGYWTMTLRAEEGEIDVNAAFFDDGTVQGLYGAVRTEGLNRRVDYAPDSYGTWEVDGSSIVLFGGTAQDISGTIINETSMTGSLTDQSGTTTPWTAIKTGELDRLLSIAGTWMLNFTVNGQERFEQLECAPNGLCEVVWEKYPGLYEGAPGQERFYTYHHQGGYNFQLESTDGSLSHDLNAGWEDYWGGWEAEGTATNNNDGSSDQSYGVKMSD